jgi:hypothetical protein
MLFTRMIIPVGYLILERKQPPAGAAVEPSRLAPAAITSGA